MHTQNVGSVLALALVLAGCADAEGNTSDSVAEAAHEESGVGALPIEQRLVFMSGHVEAGLALYRAGESEAAAPHLLHPVSETHADEVAGLDALGFDPAPFEAVSAALEAGEPAATVEPQLAAAEANLAAMRDATEADPFAQIRFLMDTAVEEYSIAITDGAVSDPAEYQDAWGFTKVASDIAEGISNGEDIQGALEEMLALWPETAPIPPADPASPEQISALAERVREALPQ